MADDPRVQQLLDQLLSGHATPEEVCASCPELLPVVRNRWRQLRLLRADLDAPVLFSDDSSCADTGRGSLMDQLDQGALAKQVLVVESRLTSQASSTWGQSDTPLPPAGWRLYTPLAGEVTHVAPSHCPVGRHLPASTPPRLGPGAFWQGLDIAAGG